MEYSKLKIGLVIFVIGFIGVLSTLTMNIPLPEEMMEKVLKQFSPTQFKFMLLINPTIFLLIAVVIGTILYDKVNLKILLIDKKITNSYDELLSVLKSGILLGLLTGIVIGVLSISVYGLLPMEFVELGKTMSPNFFVRIMYGGFTEEIIVRFGLMTFLVWLLFRICKTFNPSIYWTAILVSAAVFALGHLPMVLISIKEITPMLISYILIGNSLGGIVFGYLFWKKGLECAIIAHIFTHVALFIFEKQMF